MNALILQANGSFISEPRQEETGLRSLRLGKAQTGLLSYRDKLES